MARGDLELDPRHAARTGRLLADVGEQLAAIRNVTGADIEGVNDIRPWGRDDLGSAFAAGYAESAAHVLQAWKDVAYRTTQLGVQIAQAADSAIRTDRMTSEIIDNIR